MTDIQISFALALGSELVREEDLPPDADLSELAGKDSVFGALIVDVDGEEILDEQTWDRLDVVLERFVEALDEAEDGSEGVAEFPETRVELVLRPGEDEDGEVELEFEDTAVTVRARELRRVLGQCIERLIDRLDDVGGKLAPRVDRLRELMQD